MEPNEFPFTAKDIGRILECSQLTVKRWAVEQGIENIDYIIVPSKIGNRNFWHFSKAAIAAFQGKKEIPLLKYPQYAGTPKSVSAMHTEKGYQGLAIFKSGAQYRLGTAQKTPFAAVNAAKAALRRAAA